MKNQNPKYSLGRAGLQLMAVLALIGLFAGQANASDPPKPYWSITNTSGSSVSVWCVGNKNSVGCQGGQWYTIAPDETVKGNMETKDDAWNDCGSRTGTCVDLMLSIYSDQTKTVSYGSFQAFQTGDYNGNVECRVTQGGGPTLTTQKVKNTVTWQGLSRDQYDCVSFVRSGQQGYLRNRGDSSTCIQTTTTSYSNGNNLHLWDSCSNGTPQENRIWEYDSANQYIRLVANSDYCLAKTTAGWVKGDNIQLWKCDDVDDEFKTWKFTSSGHIIAVDDINMCIERQNANSSNGNNIILTKCSSGGADDRGWHLQW